MHLQPLCAKVMNHVARGCLSQELGHDLTFLNKVLLLLTPSWVIKYMWWNSFAIPTISYMSWRRKRPQWSGINQLQGRDKYQKYFNIEILINIEIELWKWMRNSFINSKSLFFFNPDEIICLFSLSLGILEKGGLRTKNGNRHTANYN